MNTPNQSLKPSYALRFTLLTIVCSTVLVGCDAIPVTQRTIEKNKEAIAKSLNSSLVSVKRNGDHVQFISDGAVGVEQAGQWQETFSLRVGERFQAKPDHHTSTTFMVKDIKEGSVTLKYDTQFNHQSFGKNLITQDLGEVEIPYKGK